MTYISIDTSNKQATLFLAYLKTLPFVTIHQHPNPVTKKAMSEAKNGKIKKHKNAKNLIAHLDK